MQAGIMYEFDSAEQTVKSYNGLYYTIKGYHEFLKIEDNVFDRIFRRSWYIMDGDYLVDLGRNSYIETRCLNVKTCVGCKHFFYNNSGAGKCEKNCEKFCIPYFYMMKEREVDNL